VGATKKGCRGGRRKRSPIDEEGKGYGRRKGEMRWARGSCQCLKQAVVLQKKKSRTPKLRGKGLENQSESARQERKGAIVREKKGKRGLFFA